MNAYYIKGDILLLTLTTTVIIGTRRYRIMDTATRIFYYLSVLTLLGEALAYYAAYKYANNLPVYNIFNILELFLISLYFNYSIASFRKKKVGILLGIAGIIIGVVNNFFIQSVNSITSYFLLYQAWAIIIMGIIALSAFMKDDDTRQIKKEVHFWLPVILIFSYCFTYLLFTLVSFYSKDVPTGVSLSLFLISIITNLSIATVFFFYPKMNADVR